VSASSKTPEATSWDSRIKFLKAWAKLNRSALIIGGIVALALLIGIVLWSRLKGRGDAAGKAPGKSPAKPTTEKVAGRPTVEDTPVTSTPVATGPVASAPKPRQEVWTPQTARAGFAAASLHKDADQDREVFEL
jgi:hypothetical protein